MRTRSCGSASQTIRSKTRLSDVVPRDRHAAGVHTAGWSGHGVGSGDRSRGKEQEQQRRRAEMEAGRTEHGPRHEQMRGARCLFSGYLLDKVASAIQFPAAQSLHQTVRPVLLPAFLCPHFLSEPEESRFSRLDSDAAQDRALPGARGRPQTQAPCALGLPRKPPQCTLFLSLCRRTPVPRRAQAAGHPRPPHPPSTRRTSARAHAPSASALAGAGTR